ncbi:MAG: response regulator transcription factor [Pedobacter sp.]|nr:MAG: response regulator transcription factor [Pedobacter sp.]
MKFPIKVIIADNHPIIRNGITSLVGTQDNIEVIAEASKGFEVIDFLEKGNLPDILITDIETSDLDGIELTRFIKSNYPQIKVLILTSVEHEKLITKCFDAGADGYLLKNVTTSEIVFAVEQLNAGYKYLSTSIGMKLLDPVQKKFSVEAGNMKPSVQFSKRELTILKLIAEGFTNTEIADKLFTSKRTIEGNRQNLLHKTGKKNTAELIGFAIRNAIID